MLITNHTVAGAVVGALAPGPASAFALGVVSHVVMDVVPHWGDEREEVFLRVAVPDGLLGLAVMGHLARRTSTQRRATVVAGMLGACFPDADKPSELFFGRSPFPHAVDEAHRRIQTESPRRMPQEVLVATLGLLLARRLLAR